MSEIKWNKKDLSNLEKETGIGKATMVMEVAIREFMRLKLNPYQCMAVIHGTYQAMDDGIKRQAVSRAVEPHVKKDILNEIDKNINT